MSATLNAPNDDARQAPLYSLAFFPNEIEARAYRHKHGSGGWIFVPENREDESILFPPHFTPMQIMLHPVTRGRNGAILS